MIGQYGHVVNLSLRIGMKKDERTEARTKATGDHAIMFNESKKIYLHRRQRRYRLPALAYVGGSAHAPEPGESGVCIDCALGLRGILAGTRQMSSRSYSAKVIIVS